MLVKLSIYILGCCTAFVACILGLLRLLDYSPGLGVLAIAVIALTIATVFSDAREVINPGEL